MKALVFEEVGQYPVYKDYALSSEEAGSVVEIHASALNHRDLWITEGMYPGIQTPCVLGSDGAGVCEGRAVVICPSIGWGDHEAYQADEFTVLGMPLDGTFADKIHIQKQYIYDKPAHLTMEEAAALPLAGVTAYRTLFSRCQAAANEKVLISGVGGGVALFAMQFAIAQGCEVYVTSGNEEKIAKAVALGAKGGVNYKSPEWYKALRKMAGGFDVIIDSAGGDGFQHFVKLCNPGARIGFYGASLGKYNNINPQILFWRQVSILGSTMGSDQDFADMLAFVDKHQIKPIVDEVIPIENAHLGFDKMKAGKQFGKIVFKNR